jgi:mannan endo-1,4-beta-mannosidase
MGPGDTVFSRNPGATATTAGNRSALSGRYAVLLLGVCVLASVVGVDWSRTAVASGTGPLTPARASERALMSSGAQVETLSLGQSGATTISGPTVTSLSPYAVSAGGGATVLITGRGLGATKAVYFGMDQSSWFSVVSPDAIDATAPTNEGTVGVTVVTPSGISTASQASQLRYIPTGQLPLTASGQNLEVGGVPKKLSGVNAYEIATAWGTNAGCGGMESAGQIASLFASLAPNSIVRFWAFQGDLATNVNTHQIDWAPIDQVFYLAAQYHVYLIPVITDQGGTCDGQHWQDPSWYAGGYKDVFDDAANSADSGLTPLSYWTYLQDIVARYGNSPALGMWEPVSEAEASTCPTGDEPLRCSGHQTCPDEGTAAADLSAFFTAVGGEIHSLDPGRLIEEGLLGGGQCGTAGQDFQKVGASPGIDVLSVHDYYGPTALGGDRWNGLADRFAQAAALDKPIVAGEVGIIAGNGPGCESLAERASDMAAKMKTQFATGSSAFLVWDWTGDPPGRCSYNTGPGDPLMGLLER